MRARSIVARAPRVRSSLPDDERLTSVRDLADRFPSAGLSRVAMIRVPTFEWAGGPRIWLAVESLQITGSFKVRGALVALARHRANGVRRVLAASAGNHGAGVAWAARVLGLEAEVVVPTSAPRKKVAAIVGAGATVVEFGDGYDAAERHAQEAAKARGLPFVSPYDDVDVIAGNGGSLGFEIAATLPDPARARLLAPIGGGGLATGLACAFDAVGGAGRRVVGVQSEASAAFAASLERAEAVTTLPPAVTLADGLEGGIAETAFARAAGTLAGALVVDEGAIAGAMRVAFRDFGLSIEGSAAVTLAALLDLTGSWTSPGDGRDTDDPFGLCSCPDLVAVLTGRNVDWDRLSSIVC